MQLSSGPSIEALPDRVPQRWKVIGLVASLAATACDTRLPPPVPPPPAQTTADCISPTYATDAFVCADPHLRALDRHLAALWAAVDADPRTTDAERAVQAAWFRERGMCAFRTDQRACVETAYRMRMAALER